MTMRGYSFELMALRKSEVIGAIPQSQLDASNSTAPLTNTGPDITSAFVQNECIVSSISYDSACVTIDVGCAFNV